MSDGDVMRKISAGKLREIGFEISRSIPDCAEASTDGLRMEALNFSSPEEGVVSCDIKMSLAHSFEWVEFNVERERGFEMDNLEQVVEYKEEENKNSKAVPERPEMITLIGSSRYCDVMAVCAWFLERDENKIALGLHLLPTWYCGNKIEDHLAEHEGVAGQLDQLHRRKIDRSESVFLVDFHGYIGDSTRAEIEYAEKAGKPIRKFSDDPIGGRVQKFLREKAVNWSKESRGW